MRVLFDQGTPVPLRQHLSPHEVRTAFELQWGTLRNGELIERAEAEGFEVLITTDQNLKYQQNLTTRRIAIVVISTTSWPRIRNHVEAVAKAVVEAASGTYCEVAIP